MRIRNLFIQGLIAGTVLLIPTAVFAEKGEHGNHQSNAQQNKQFTTQSKQTSERNSSRYEHKQTVKRSNTKNVSASKPQFKNRAVKQPVQGSQRHSVPNQTKSFQQNRQRNMNDHNDLKENQRNQLSVVESKPAIHKRTTPLPIHTEKPFVKPENKSVQTIVKNKRMDKEDHETQVPAVNSKKITVHAEHIQGVQKVPLDRPFEKDPETQDTKVIPVNSGQNSTHSSQTNDGGGGASNYASIKASLGLPIIFQSGEKVFVYFSRLDLLRSQWVNAPPSKPPKSAL
ncbi:hypothetical protein [Fictibacillus barbaricus]|uniref:Uncharacterized protein n=1 Tax=Fictibacillus barbaricus TaxID=182136 RepID=A0ABU1U553_9BACL|nr:hypothetical protein [Fictibacillus barbaricus]MDR7074595.1 hypothetical protein [Fictibacillus barbaricus]